MLLGMLLTAMLLLPGISLLKQRDNLLMLLVLLQQLTKVAPPLFGS